MKRNKTHRNKARLIIGLGIVCALIMSASVWYAIHYNESRLVVKSDSSEYVFRMQDLPMIVSLILFICYLMYLIVLIVRVTIKNNFTAKSMRITRKLNPRFGFFGLFGFVGFLGFWTYYINKEIYPFVSFVFFGFFGFFYEGKMSNTYMDERYEENKMKAQLVAMKTAFYIIIIALFIVGQGRFIGNLEYTLIALVIIVSLAIGLEIFLSEYLLYRYDHDDRLDESGD